jgi:hypothetical protein
VRKFEVAVRPGTWTVALGDLELEASGAIRDRGSIRCILSVKRSGRLLFRDKVNLTGDRSRRRVIQRVSELAPGASVSEDALLALDEAIRMTPRPERNGRETIYDGSPDFSGEVRTLADLTAIVNRWLLLEDADVLPVTLGAIAAHRLGGESPWLLLVAPPSGTKTEILRMTWTTPGIYPLSELTARTFASGLETQGEDPSLLARLRDESLVLKDLTTILEMHQEERQAVLAQLREIYDGRYDKAWGTGKELHWTGRLGFLAGVTPIIDQHHAVMALVGPRFVQLRMVGSDRCEVAERAMENADHEEEMRRELAGACAAFLATVPRTPPEVPPEVRRWLARVADLVTRARSPVLRDGWKRDFEYAPEPEMPARLARQLHALLRGIALVAGHVVVQPEDTARIARVAADCIPGIRRKVLDALQHVDGWVRTTDVANSVQHARTTVVRALEDLQGLGLVSCKKGGQGVPDEWVLTNECRELMEALATSPEKSEGRRTETEPATSPEKSDPRHTHSFAPGDLVNCLSNGTIYNAEPWRIVDIAEGPDGEYALFDETPTCRIHLKNDPHSLLMVYDFVSG